MVSHVHYFLSLFKSPELPGEMIGKTSFFVINQDKVKCLSNEELTEIEEKCKAAEEANKARAAKIKSFTTGGLF
jgi:hypothetical protein